MILSDPIPEKGDCNFDEQKREQEKRKPLAVEAIIPQERESCDY